MPRPFAPPPTLSAHMSAHGELHDRNAALATLIALRSTLPNPDEARRDAYVFLPEHNAVDRKTAVATLIGLPKPLSCVAVAAGGPMAIACWPLDEQCAARLHGHQIASRLQYLVRLEQSSREHGGNAALLLEANGESMVFDREDLRVWWSSYLLPLSGFAISSSDSASGHRNIQGVLRYSRLTPSDSGGVSQTRGDAGESDR